MDKVNLKLKKYNQEHLINFYKELNEEEKDHLLKQIESIDFDFIKEQYENKNLEIKDKPNITPMSSFDTTEEYKQSGYESIKNSEYAVVTMAGGQGTRLGHSGPKGTYLLEYGINKSLFEIQCDKLKTLYRECNVYIPWYIMTSKSNNDETIKFFNDNNYFNYPQKKIKFFIQDELPMVDINGKIIMDSKSNIKMGANGSGGIFEALSNSGIIDEIKNNLIKWIMITGIDNILTPIDNPDLIGFSKINKYLVSSKIVRKDYPEEKVGVFCKRNGKPGVIEYIHMTEEMNNMVDSNGNLLYGQANILSMVFNIEALELIKDKPLPFISALKKSSYMNELGELVEPEIENAYKFECFIFDSFSNFNDIGLLGANREDVFAPIKNATGVDSPETASKLYLNYFQK